MSLLGSLFGGGTQTQTTTPDPATMQWIAQYRKYLSGLQPGLENGMGDQYDAINRAGQFQSGLLGQQVASQATQAGAFGGNRMGVMQALGQRDINSGMQDQYAQAAQQQWMRRMQYAQAMAGAGQMGGTRTRRTQPGAGLVPGLLGVGAMASGLGFNSNMLPGFLGGGV